MDIAALIADLRNRDRALGAWCAFAEASEAEIGPNAAPDADFHDIAHPLKGWTVGVKDIIDVAGLPTRCGSRILADAAPATVDAACVSILRTAGAVIVGKTVTTELATFVPAATRNPAAPDRSPGGSSAGSAAAVAAGHVRLALGTQTAGSVLRPAAYCGVVGFKPSFGSVPRTGIKLQSESLDTVGVLARTVADCRRWREAMDIADSPSADQQEVAPRALRVAFVDDWLERADPVMREALTALAEALLREGHRPRHVALPPTLHAALEAQQTIQSFESARAYHAERTRHRDLLTPALAESLDRGATIPAGAYQAALAVAKDARETAARWFGDFDLMAMPAAPGEPPTLASGSTGDPLFNRLATVLHLPAISLPLARAGDLPPLGIQLIGCPRGDDVLLRHATCLQSIDSLKPRPAASRAP